MPPIAKLRSTIAERNRTLSPVYRGKLFIQLEIAAVEMSLPLSIALGECLRINAFEIVQSFQTHSATVYRTSRHCVINIIFLKFA